MDTEQQINVPLLRKSLEWATAEHWKALRGKDSEWNQANWCGTKSCIAGHVALETGWTPVRESDLVKTTAFVHRNGVERLVPEVAREALGLDGYDAARLFHSANGIETLWDIANDLTDGAIEIPADLPNDVNESKIVPDYDEKNACA